MYREMLIKGHVDCRHIFEEAVCVAGLLHGCERF